MGATLPCGLRLDKARGLADIHGMEWRAEGMVLAVRRLGESNAIIELFTQDHGRHLGVVRGGASRRMAPLLQPGAQLDATWRARLDTHLGAFSVDLIESRAAAAMQDRLRLAGLTAVCAVLSFALPEREAHPALYARSLVLLDGLGAERWPQAYLAWELALLEEMGFGLDLTRCAVTGATSDLAFISPRTGRAVSRGAAGDWVDRLLPLPGMLVGLPGAAGDLAQGLRVTGHFLDAHLAPALGDRPIPPARHRLADLLVRSASAA
jgi:DNA repair protein RecO (recombination protein O)